MSVMTSAGEEDRVANSCSMAARSSRRRSKTSFAVAMEIVLTRSLEYQQALVGSGAAGANRWGGTFAPGKKGGVPAPRVGGATDGGLEVGNPVAAAAPRGDQLDEDA